MVPHKQPGLLIEYNAFVSLDDTVAVKLTALALWKVLCADQDTANVGFVVLRATTRDPAIQGYQQVRAFGVVIEKRKNGKWYVLGDSVTVDRR